LPIQSSVKSDGYVLRLLAHYRNMMIALQIVEGHCNM